MGHSNANTPFMNQTKCIFVCRMAASCEEDRSSWVQTLQDNIEKDKFYDIISSKKAAQRRKSLRHIHQHDIPNSSEPTIVPLK